MSTITYTTHKWPIGLRLAALAAMTALTRAAVAQDAPEPPSEVWVFNGGESFYGYTTTGMDSANTAAYAMIMDELGLLDGQGHAPEWAPDNTLLQDGVVVGRAIVCQVNEHTSVLCGFESLDGTKRAYDLNSPATFRRAWEEVAHDGTITIVKHGMEVQDHSGNLTQAGGALALDNGTMYDGFRSDSDTSSWGTWNLGNGPYALPERPGADIYVRLDVCYGANDHDGPAQGISVLETLESIPGVGVAIGETDEVTVTSQISFLGAPPQHAVRAFFRVLRRLAAEAGFRTTSGAPDHWGYLNSLSYRSKLEVLDWAGQQAGVQARYSCTMNHDPANEEFFFSYNTVVPAVDLDGGLLFGTLPSENNPEPTLVQLLVPEDAVWDQTPILISGAVLDPFGFPEGLAPVSAAVTVSRYGVEDTLEFMEPSELMLEYPSVGPEPVGLYRVEPDGTLVQEPDAWIETLDHIAVTTITEGGTWVLLGDAIEDRPADFNLDRRVDVEDLLEVVDLWGACSMTWCQHDLNGNGSVGVSDLITVLEQWGSDFD